MDKNLDREEVKSKMREKSERKKKLREEIEMLKLKHIDLLAKKHTDVDAKHIYSIGESIKDQILERRRELRSLGLL